MNIYFIDHWRGLHPLMDWLNNLSHWCWDTEERIRDVWLIGEWVGPMLLDVGEFFERMRDSIFDFGCSLTTLNDFLYRLQRGWVFEDFISDIWSGWKSFISDPAWFILLRIAAMWPDFYWFIQEPTYMLGVWLSEEWPWLGEIIDDPSRWVLDRLIEVWPMFGAFLADPPQTIVDWLEERSPEVAGFLLEPDGWLIDRVWRLFPDLAAFLDDHVGWLGDVLDELIFEALERQRARLYQFGERVIRYYLEGVW